MGKQVMVEQFGIGSFLDRILDPIRGANAGNQGSKLELVYRTPRYPKRGLGFPRQRGAFGGKPHHIVADDWLAFVRHPQEVAAVAGRSYGHRAMNAQFEIFAAVLGLADFGQDGDVYRAFADLAPENVREGWINPLV